MYVGSSFRVVESGESTPLPWRKRYKHDDWHGASRPLLVEGLSGGSACDAAYYGLGFLCPLQIRRKLDAWESLGVKGTMAKLSADGASAVPEDSASDIDSESLLLPANGEAA
ncbi:hypothetical protein WJX77_008949 [Trebouxia sp. C0004]